MKTAKEYFEGESGLAGEFGHTLEVVPLADAQRIVEQVIQDCKPKWISVNEMLPNKGQKILIHGLGDRQLTSIYWPFVDNEDFYCYNMWSEELEPIEDVTHWMELPSVPE